ncbi:Pycsar system effector family protein [Kitasatospora sp. MY 5-36]|uniref:Pycsar system effector family protein n=1 Tax=Kitasatospora sp. MY 5-36 TaxID=1678027 RepID=UPI000670D96D|nr:Pycsar system effector family protein [Kitasatospora sp. MY 5-36]
METEQIAAALTTVTSEIGKADNKANMFLAVDGILVAAVANLDNLHTPGRILAALGVLTLVAAIVVAILVVRPRLASTPGTTSFVHWAKNDPATLQARLAQEDQLVRLQHLSRICTTKMRLLTAAADLTLAAGAALALAALLSAI